MNIKNFRHYDRPGNIGLAKWFHITTLKSHHRPLQSSLWKPFRETLLSLTWCFSLITTMKNVDKINHFLQGFRLIFNKVAAFTIVSWETGINLINSQRRENAILSPYSFIHSFLYYFFHSYNYLTNIFRVHPALSNILGSEAVAGIKISVFMELIF